MKDNLNIEVNYKNKKRYKTSKLPRRQPIYLMWLIWLLSKIMLIGKKYKVEKIDMEGLKPPYMLLSNHMYFIDFELASQGTYPHRVNNVVSIDGYYRRPWLMEWIGVAREGRYPLYVPGGEIFTLRNHLVYSRVGRNADKALSGTRCGHPSSRKLPAFALLELSEKAQGAASHDPDADTDG